MGGLDAVLSHRADIELAVSHRSFRAGGEAKAHAVPFERDDRGEAVGGEDARPDSQGNHRVAHDISPSQTEMGMARVIATSRSMVRSPAHR